MVKNTLVLKYHIGIEQFFKSPAFLKRQNVGFIPRMSNNVLLAEQIAKIMIEAPNGVVELLSKVKLSLGIFGGC